MIKAIDEAKARAARYGSTYSCEYSGWSITFKIIKMILVVGCGGYLGIAYLKLFNSQADLMDRCDSLDIQNDALSDTVSILSEEQPITSNAAINKEKDPNLAQELVRVKSLKYFGKYIDSEYYYIEKDFEGSIMKVEDNIAFVRFDKFPNVDFQIELDKLAEIK